MSAIMKMAVVNDANLGVTQEYIKTRSRAMIKHCIDTMFNKLMYDQDTGYIRLPLFRLYQNRSLNSVEFNILDLDDQSLVKLITIGGGDITDLITDHCVQTERHRTKLIYAFLVAQNIPEIRFSDFSCEIPPSALAHYMWQVFPLHKNNNLANDILDHLPKLSNEDGEIYRDVIISQHTKTIKNTSTAATTLFPLIQILCPVWDDRIDAFITDLVKDAKDISYINVNLVYLLIPDKNAMTSIMESFFRYNWNRDTIKSLDESILEHFKVLYRTNIVLNGPPAIEIGEYPVLP